MFDQAFVRLQICYLHKKIQTVHLKVIESLKMIRHLKTGQLCALNCRAMYNSAPDIHNDTAMKFLKSNGAHNDDFTIELAWGTG